MNVEDMSEQEMTRCEGIKELEKTIKGVLTSEPDDVWYHTVKAEYVAEGLALFWVTGIG